MLMRTDFTSSRPAAMPMDAHRDGDDLVIHLDLPGVDAESIDLVVERNVLTVRADRRRVAGDDVELLVAERPSGTFRRQLFLGDSLDTDRTSASYVDGVLTLRVPVAERAKPRRVPITLPESAPAAIDAESVST